MSTFDKLSEWESPQARAVREEIEAMSEDPVKPDKVKFGDIRKSPSWAGGVPRAELSPAAQIRIEALRAAVRFDNLASSERAIEFAKQFAAYLESGE